MASPHRRIRTSIASTIAALLLLGACSSTSVVAGERDKPAGGPAPTLVAESTTEVAPTSAPEPTTEPAVSESAGEPEFDVLDQAFVGATIDQVRLADGTALLAAIDANGAIVEAGRGTDANGVSPTATDAFRVGSITKVFTALAVLTMVDDGDIELDAPAADYVTRVAVPAEVTVRDLLQHRTGIANYTDDASFLGAVFTDPSRIWTPEEVLEGIADEPAVTEPGSRFSYSNSNYMILGVLIEEVTGQQYHEVVRIRIIDRLGLTSTYLAEFEPGQEPFDRYAPEGDDVTFDYTSAATGAWAAGAMVSSAPDLHTLFTALFDNRIVSPESMIQMTTGIQYGFGVELGDWPRGVIGHNGGIFGYITSFRFAPATGVSTFLVTTEDTIQPTPTILGDLVTALANHTP